MTQFVITPTEDWLKLELSRCEARLLVSSPYITAWLPNLHKKLGTTIQRVLPTRTDLRDFASGASDLDAVCNLARAHTKVISSNRLHAKVYVIDEACALVTSANATFSGMRGNLECGVALRDKPSVCEAARLVLGGFGVRETPQHWSLAELESLREPVRRVQESLTHKLVTSALEDRQLPDIDPDKPLGRALVDHLPGWTRLALEGIQKQATFFDLNSFVGWCLTRCCLAEGFVGRRAPWPGRQPAATGPSPYNQNNTDVSTTVCCGMFSACGSPLP